MILLCSYVAVWILIVCWWKRSTAASTHLIFTHTSVRRPRKPSWILIDPESDKFLPLSHLIIISPQESFLSLVLHLICFNYIFHKGGVILQKSNKAVLASSGHLSTAALSLVPLPVPTPQHNVIYDESILLRSDWQLQTRLCIYLHASCIKPLWTKWLKLALYINRHYGSLLTKFFQQRSQFLSCLTLVKLTNCQRVGWTRVKFMWFHCCSCCS